ncbi:MAG TPA: hypothetical protein VFK47_01750 [Ktedonobacteraceae bacterium]|nr:hypothetical protein [Ktedonobacteraceae bacterium]
MDPQQNRPNLSLPQPAIEPAVVSPPANGQTDAAVQVPASTNPVGMPPQSITPMSTSAAPAGEDMTKLWIDKAKEIVAATKNDPYVQSKELSKVKAAFLKANYHKDIKVVEE